ncbi:CoA pyrophosphatase [Marivivens sp. JLT3646]|uniref:NUDIX hydrolase n=1 Tax=Marivivens sp. JLT3646 TaxID=1920883 RepID=UPI000800952B|nr:CoA pyrophosphatase [Marivivens sp. JLT3646]APO88039.1 coenzyme A pyrophosphatase [Marivivens sp. JLT3646]OBR35039.1 coenzyme A pyrophosphatase [Donghicola sp. JL3646]
MIQRNKAEDRLIAALYAQGGETSDFDLNPDTKLPENRVLKPAAVLVAFHEDGRLLLTKRSARLKHHPGQIAFPGGKVELGETLVDAALREAQEEVGLDPSQVNVLGTLPSHETVTSYVVTPVVSMIRGDWTPVPELGEVEEVFTVPFDHIANRTNYRIEGRRWQGRRRYYFTAPYGPYYIWGATARMLRGLAERLCD